MQDPITTEEIATIDRVWHKVLLSLQKMSEEVWKDKLAGISTIEVSILSILEKKPDVILKEVVSILGIPASTLTSAVDRLEKRNLVHRIISPKDRRSFGLALTEDGKIAQQEHLESEKVLWQKVLGSYDTKEERLELAHLLEKLADSLEGSGR